MLREQADLADPAPTLLGALGRDVRAAEVLGSIKSPADYDPPSADDLNKQELAHEPEYLKIEGGLPALRPDQLKQGLV